MKGTPVLKHILKVILCVNLVLFLILGASDRAAATDLGNANNSFINSLFQQYFPDQDVKPEEYDYLQDASDDGAYGCEEGTSECGETKEGEEPFCCNDIESDDDGNVTGGEECCLGWKADPENEGQYVQASATCCAAKIPQGNGSYSGEACCGGVECCNYENNETCAREPVNPEQPEAGFNFVCRQCNEPFISCGSGCCDLSDGSSEQCCGQVCIDTEKEECCGGYPIDKRTEQCCNGVPIVPAAGEKCCDGEQACPPDGQCCGKSCARTEIADPRDPTNPPLAVQCCDDKAYVPELEGVCCRGKLYVPGSTCCEDAVAPNEPRACGPGFYCELTLQNVVKCTPDPTV
jgi:hypothetical protein